MKYFIPLFALLLIGGGCIQVTPVQPEETTEQSSPEENIEIIDVDYEEVQAIEGEYIQTSWNRLTDAIVADDCEAFKQRFVYNVELDDQDCTNYFSFYNFIPPNIGWDLTTYRKYVLQDGTTIYEAQLYIASGTPMAAFYLDDDNTWRSARIFWTVNHAE